MNVNDKVTIYNRGSSSSQIIAGVTTIVSITARQINTADGRKWKAKGSFWNEEVGNENRLIKSYKEGDEDRVERQRRLNAARELFRLGHEWQICDDFALLSDADIDALAGIVGRLKEARKAKKGEV